MSFSSYLLQKCRIGIIFSCFTLLPFLSVDKRYKENFSQLHWWRSFYHLLCSDRIITVHCAVLVLVVLHFSRRRWSLTMWNFDIKSGIQPGRKRLTVFYISDVLALIYMQSIMYSLISSLMALLLIFMQVYFSLAYFTTTTVTTTTTTTTFI